MDIKFHVPHLLEEYRSIRTASTIDIKMVEDIGVMFPHYLQWLHRYIQILNITVLKINRSANKI